MTEIMYLKEMDTALIVERCVEILAAGRLVILPTDTVYGLAARVDIPSAVEAVFTAKGRDAEKALVVMVSNAREAEELAAPEERGSLRRLGALWPGPLTLVIKVGDIPWKESVAPGSETLGIRVPDNPLLLGLLGISGPLAVTSANPAGARAPVSLEDIDAGLLGTVGLAVDGGYRGSGKPSTVAEIEESEIRVLRQGEITEEELRRALTHGREDKQPRAAAYGRTGEE